jgi:spore maturation protein CgeB
MRRLRGKLFYRVADRCSWEWWGFQRQLKEKIRTMRLRLVLVTGILPCQTSIFETIKERGGRIANYLTNDHWNPIHRRRSFLRNLRHYDHIFCTKKALCRRLEKAGTPSNSRLHFAYNPALHHPPFTTHSCKQR